MSKLQTEIKNGSSLDRNLQIHQSSWPKFEADEIAAVEKVLLSGKVNYWTGQETRQFEKEFAEYVGTTYAIALSNGTVALEAALKAIDLQQGDEVIVPSKTFIATASAVAMQGAIPIVADIDPVSQNITADTIKPLITHKTKAIIVVHVAGWPCEMDNILKLANEHNLWVIEDCAQAHGASYHGKQVGSMGHIGAFSFCQDKIMTTGGEGGMITTNNKAFWEKMWSLKDHGKDYEKAHTKSTGYNFRWLHDSFGTNWRMTEVQGAIGRIQLRKLNSWNEQRKRNAKVFEDFFQTLPLFRVAKPPTYINHAYYKYYVFIENSYLKPGWSRERILNEFNQLGLPCFTGICNEIYLEKAFEHTASYKKRLPVAQELSETSLMFQVDPTLSDRNIQMMCEKIQNICNDAMIVSQ